MVSFWGFEINGLHINDWFSLKFEVKKLIFCLKHKRILKNSLELRTPKKSK